MAIPRIIKSNVGKITRRPVGDIAGVGRRNLIGGEIKAAPAGSKTLGNR